MPEFFSLGPHDSAKLDALLGGLNAGIVPLSSVKDGNEKVRFDSGYFDKQALLAVGLLEGKVTEPLGAITSTLRKGIFDIKADTYVNEGEGVPFVRIGDMKGGLIEASSTAWISHKAHTKERKTALHFGDIVLSKTAYPAASFINLRECNASQDVVAVKFSKDGAKRFKSGFVTSYLNGKIGLPIMSRFFQGNVQQHLSLDDAKKIELPRLSDEFQERVHKCVLGANDRRKEALTKVGQAETALLKALGLADWAPPEPLAYSAASAATVASGRLDAQYFMPAKTGVQEALRRLPGKPLGERFVSIRQLMDPKKDTAPPIVRNYDVTDALQPILDDEKEPVATEEIGSTKKVLKNGDVAISRLRAYLREIAVIKTDGKIPAVGSSEFIVLRPKTKTDKAIAPETLLTFLRSAPVQTILKWCQDGSQHPRFSEGDLLAIHFPDAVEAASAAIAAIVQEGFEARARARTLLDAAKRAVEIAIEDSEAAALAYLDKMGAA